MNTVNAKYKGAIKKSGFALAENSDLPIEIHQMILWSILHPDEAMALIPFYERIREIHSKPDATAVPVAPITKEVRMATAAKKPAAKAPAKAVKAPAAKAPVKKPAAKKAAK